ncbi:MAG: prepilin peptidase [Firmicutes bacterium]|nr:prepilin peptidase [Bacillota bacterium]
MLPVLMAFVCGLLCGSFLNVCIYRLPRKESVAYPPSHCPACGRRLQAAELVPVVSYLWQRGHCRGCGAVISPRYLLVEILTGLVFAALAWRFGWPALLWHAAFFAVLIVILFIDLDHMVIPNCLVLLLAVFLPARLLAGEIFFLQAVAGMLLGGGFFFLLASLSRGGMGEGDVKLAAMLGLWYGWKLLLPLIFLAFLGGGAFGVILLALKVKRRKDAIPFGPFLVLAAFLVSMWGKQIIAWYLRTGGFVEFLSAFLSGQT